MTAYELSPQNRVHAVSDDWDDFATCNDGGGAVAKEVTGRLIWSCVSGLATTSYLNALLFSVRKAQTSLCVAYRCDSPQEMLRYEMWMEPLAAGAVLISHVQTDAAPRVPASRRAQWPGGAACCSQCLRWQSGAVWEELDLHPGLTHSAVEYLICPDCRNAALRAIAKTQAMRARY